MLMKSYGNETLVHALKALKKDLKLIFGVLHKLKKIRVKDHGIARNTLIGR